MKELNRKAGFAIIWENKILLSHATRAPWHHSYSIIKGEIEGDESFLQTARREFKEELNIDLSADILYQAAGQPDFVVQKDKKVLTGWFIVINSLSEIGLESPVIPKSQLQLEEIDWAGFVDFEEARKRIAPYQLPILDKAIEFVKGLKGAAAPVGQAHPSSDFFSEEAINFVPVMQLKVVREIVSDEEGKQEMQDVFERINKAVAEMPKTYETDDVEIKDKKIWLRYFAPNAEWLIVEKDMGSEDDEGMHKGLQHQAFGFANIGGAADEMNDGLGEMGYISIQELRQIPSVELDFYFRPTTARELIEKRNKKRQPQATDKPNPLKAVPIAKRVADFKLATEKYYDEKFHSLHLFETELLYSLVKSGFVVKHPENEPPYHLVAEKNGVQVHVSDQKTFFEIQCGDEIKEIYKYSTTKPNFENVDHTDEGIVFLLTDAINDMVAKAHSSKVQSSPKENPVPTMTNTETVAAKETPQPDTSATTSDKAVDLTKIVNDEVKHIRYVPVSDACGWSLNTVVPKGMAQEMYNALFAVRQQLKNAYGWDLDDYVQNRLQYTPEELGIDRELYDRLDEQGQRNAINAKLCEALAPEQIDAVALAIYNIEVRRQGMIVGDMTGIGKGRIAAALIRYCIVYQKKAPVFLTEKSYLFSDIYRDIIDVKSDPAIPIEIKTGEREREVKMNKAQIAAAVKDLMENNGYTRDEAIEEIEQKISIGKEMVPVYRTNEHYKKQVRQSRNRMRIVPFILNNDDSRTRVQDGDGNILYYAQKNANQEFKTVLEKKTLPKDYNMVMATYSQLSSSDKSKKKAFFEAITKDTIVLCDESHNASGTSNTGNFIRELLEESLGAVFLSATYAKRPDNMAIYAAKTSMIETGMPSDQITAAILSGGVALQEIISSQLVAEGQMVRRERTFEGVNILWRTMGPEMSKHGMPQYDLSDRHRAIADSFTTILRDIIDLQNNYIRKWTRDPEVAKAFLDQYYGQVEIPKGYDVKKTLGQSTVFSRVFNVMNQLLFSIKCEAIANRAIDYLKQGKKPVIAFSNTMESFLDQMTTEDGRYLQDGDIVNADFKLVLTRLLDNLRYLNVKSPEGNVTKISLPEDKVPEEITQMFRLIESKIERISIGISISPIDVILKKISDAGFKVEEITGRESRLVYLDETFLTARYEKKKKAVATNLFRSFNQNETDCLLINQSGSTGGSIHAKPNDVVNHVKISTGINEYATVPYKKDLDGEILVPDSLEPRNEVKQRVMIILQPELNINTEVQKRGRIFRSGQVLMPMYEYLCSNIPAEMRFQMMLQKKLRSLDANTSSNQKASDDILNIVDFLNPIGDALVVDYLLENKALILRLGDPLKMYNEEKNSYEVPNDITDAAHKVTGRVAVLNISEQEKFYTELSQRYTDKVSMLKATGEYDMEVEYYDLQATTLDRTVFTIGTGKGSLFGRNAVMELCEVNNLRKPYDKATLVTMMDEAVEEYFPSRNPGKEKQKHLLQLHSQWQQEKLANIERDYEKRAEWSISRLSEDEKYIKLKKKNPQEAEKWLVTMRENVKKRIQEDLINDKEALSVRYSIVHNYLQRIYPGMVFNYVMEDKAEIKAVVIDVAVDTELSNPWTPSAIKVKIAVANSIRMLQVPMSQTAIIDSMVAHVELNDYEAKNTIEHWDRITKEAVADRKKDYIITGNILLGMGNLGDKWGKLIKFTTDKKKIRTGILLPNYDPNKNQQRGAQFVNVPLDKCLPILREMSSKARYMTTNNMEFSKEDGTANSAFMVRVPKNNKKYKDILTDEGILTYLNESKGFTDSPSSNLMNIWDEENNRMTMSMGMEATVEANRMEGFLKYLTTTYHVQLRVSLDVLEAKKEELGIDLTLDYDDGLGVEESESGLAQVEIKISNPEMQQVVQQQADPVTQAAEQTEQTVLEAVAEAEPQKPASDEAIEREANLLLQMQHFNLEKKFFRLYQIIQESKGKMASGGSLVNQKQLKDKVKDALKEWDEYNSRTRSEWADKIRTDFGDAGIGVAFPDMVAKQLIDWIDENVWEKFPEKTYSNLFNLYANHDNMASFIKKWEQLSEEDKRALPDYWQKYLQTRYLQSKFRLLREEYERLYVDNLEIGGQLKEDDIASATEIFSIGGTLTQKYSKAYFIEEMRMFAYFLDQQNIPYEAFDSFRTSPDNVNGIYMQVYITNLPIEKAEGLVGIAKLHNLKLSKREPHRLTFVPVTVDTYENGGVLQNYRKELEDMPLDKFADEVVANLGFDRAEVVSDLENNGDDRDSLINEIVHRYKLSLKSRGELKAEGGPFYMGDKGDEVVIQLAGSKTMPEYNLINATTYGMIDMRFSSPEEAKKYADKKGLIVVDRFKKSHGRPTITEKELLDKINAGAKVGNYTGFTIDIDGVTHRCAHKFSFAEGGNIAQNTPLIDHGTIYTAADARQHHKNWTEDYSHSDPTKIYQANRSPAVLQFYIQGHAVNKLFTHTGNSINDLGRLLWEIMFTDQQEPLEYRKKQAVEQFILNSNNYYYTRNYTNPYKYWSTEGATERQVDDLITLIYNITSPNDITYRIQPRTGQQYENVYEEGGGLRSANLLAKGGKLHYSTFYPISKNDKILAENIAIELAQSINDQGLVSITGHSFSLQPFDIDVTFVYNGGTSIKVVGKDYDGYLLAIVKDDGVEKMYKSKEGHNLKTPIGVEDATEELANAIKSGNAHHEFHNGVLMAKGGKLCPVGTEIQTLLFDAGTFTPNTAKAWAKNHQMKYGSVDTTENYHRLRQQEPENFRKDSFRTIDITEGIKAVIGCPKNNH